MGEWDIGEDLPKGETNGKHEKHLVMGRLNTPMTVACLLTVAAVSIGMAWVMKEHVRNIWEMGMTFAMPFAALMCSALLVEKATNRMTPACSRSAQAIFAAATVVAAFAVGLLAESLHQPVMTERIEPKYDYLVVLDKSGSMAFTGIEQACREAVHSLVDEMEEESRAGAVAFSDVLVGETPIQLLDQNHRMEIFEIIDTEIPIEDDGVSRHGPATDFSLAMNHAMKLVDKLADQSRTVRVILVTDGDQEARGNFEAFNRWVEKQNDPNSDQKQVELCAIQLGDPVLEMVKDAVLKTGGTIFDQTKITELAEELKSLKSTLVIPEAVDTLKATYEGMTSDGQPNTPYVMLTGVLLLMLGLLCGVSLRIMFSIQGQFRFQVVLSALMGICAFLLLNFGRHLGIAPAWLCEGMAFSLLGLVFMRANTIGGCQTKAVVPGNDKGNRDDVWDLEQR